jgi:hypothetical protein
MVERLEVVWTLVSREDLTKYKVDVAAVDAILGGQEKVKVTLGKANEAVMEVKELMVKAGVPPQVSERQEDSAEGSEEEGEKKDKAGTAGKSLLPALPYGGTAVKAVQKQNLAKITELLQNCNVTSGTPENLAMLWDDICRLIEGAGLSEAEVKAAIQGVTGQAAVTLCIG